MNPWDGLAHFCLGLINEKKIQNWYTLFFQLGFSSLNSFLYVAGGALIARAPWAVSIGMGMVSAAVVMTVIFRSSPATKGMMAVLPAGEAKTELETDLQKVQR